MIRAATVEDAVSVHRVMVEAFEEYRQHDVPSSALDETVDSIQRALRDGKERALLYFDGETPVGSCRYKLEPQSLYFARLSVGPPHRGKGIAKAILRWLEDEARSHDKAEMWCRVRLSVPRNVELYKSVGFIVTKEEVVTNPNGFPVKTVVMRRVLRP